MRRSRAIAGAILILATLCSVPMITSGTNATTPATTAQIITPNAPSPSPAPTPEQYFDEVTDPTFTGYPEITHYEPDALEVEALARMLYGEARGIPSDMEKAACVWCVLNRVDDPRFPDTVLEVLEAPYQFSGYKASYPVLPELAEIAADVLIRYHAERDDDTDAGRVLPAEYVFFTGDGRNNHFTTEWNSKDTYGWTLANPYED